MEIRMFTVGPVQENCFIGRAEGSRRGFVIDPGDEPELLTGGIEKLGATVEAILLTHTDVDHVGAVAPLAKVAVNVAMSSLSTASRRSLTGTRWLRSTAALSTLTGLKIAESTPLLITVVFSGSMS